ncbi:unnamed protein product [Linum tenue]|uniref:Uncharacterized protein n=1 Tax=Linum tenue TaxID=586396 RepID=A0AAV0J3N9_9ROSI|nr:unnamed protein product [Linum tenue]
MVHFDSFVAWDLEFPLITVKKTLGTLEHQQEWKWIIQVSKWMLNKGQGRTMGTYFILLSALAEDERLGEAEELWNKLFMRYLLTWKNRASSVSIVNMIWTVFQHRGTLDKYEKLKAKYPPPKWEFRYIKGKRVRIRAKHYREYGSERGGGNKADASLDDSSEMENNENPDENSNEEETSLGSNEFDDQLGIDSDTNSISSSRNEGWSRSDEAAFASYQ